MRLGGPSGRFHPTAQRQRDLGVIGRLAQHRPIFFCFSRGEIAHPLSRWAATSIARPVCPTAPRLSGEAACMDALTFAIVTPIAVIAVICAGITAVACYGYDSESGRCQ